ncbi:MAG TPA: hypothetical protein VG755_29770 [Nannocystaceae bacterium]|nr:hypothetical protein [Nannocystaceae bacterium]
MLARALLVVVVALGACRPARRDPVAAGEAGAASDDGGSTAPPVAKSPFDQALADMIAQCDPVIASGGADGPARAHERRIDLDRDGSDEAVFNVSCGDVSQWKLLGEKDGEAVTLLERIATNTAFDVLIGPDGSGLLVIQHDCCCMYELEVHTLKAGALQQLFAWTSGCAQGCESGYQAQVETDAAGNLRAITLPKGQCGSSGIEQVDLRAWRITGAAE